METSAGFFIIIVPAAVQSLAAVVSLTAPSGTKPAITVNDKCVLNMQQTYQQVTIKGIAADERDLLIALLSNIGFDGFEEGDDYLSAFGATGAIDVQALQQVLLDHHLHAETTHIPHQNWNETWEKNFDPVVVDDFAAVRAHFHAPIAQVQHEIIITPKMSFGTGHHATTFMMMQQMRTLDLAGKSVFDFGTGTGILAILAAKCGAANILAIDNDAWSIENATENVQRNNCSGIRLQLADTPPSAEKFDVILANINKHIILQFIDQLAGMLLPNAHLLVSGLLIEDEPDILMKTNELSLRHVNTVKQDKWISMLFLP